ncbi:hypothetical protein ACFE04_023956 [Oxalis oulophora]
MGRCLSLLTCNLLVIQADKGILNPPRHVVWVEGHKDADGKITDEATLKFVQHIYNVERDVSQGLIELGPREDILQRAFGKPPPSVRGVIGGRFATMGTFFETCQLRSDIEIGRLKRELEARDEEMANERQRNIELQRQNTEMVNQLSIQSSPTIENVSNSNPGPSRTLQLLAPSFTSQEAPQNDSSRPHPVLALPSNYTQTPLPELPAPNYTKTPPPQLPAPNYTQTPPQQQPAQQRYSSPTSQINYLSLDDHFSSLSTSFSQLLQQTIMPRQDSQASQPIHSFDHSQPSKDNHSSQHSPSHDYSRYNLIDHVSSVPSRQYARPEQVLYNTEPPHHPGGPAKVDPRICLLAIDTPTNFVAFGTWYGDGGNGMTIHGTTLPHGMCKVVVNDIIANQDNTLVPRPTDEVRTLHEAINNFIMWPSLLVSFNLEALNSRPAQKDVQKPVIPLPTGRDSLLALRRRISSFPDLGIAYQAPVQVFGYQVGYVVITKTDIEEMLRTAMIESSLITFFCWLKMNEKLQQEGEQHLYGFAMAGAIAPSGNIELESDCLARSLTSFRRPDRLTEHWYLIIINPELGRYYWLESQNLLTVSDEAKALVRRAIKKYHVHFASPPPAITHQVIRVPQQPGGTECGYYLMMVMEYIIRNRLTEFHSPLIPNKKSYKPIELNIVKEIIARGVLHLWDNMP